jgi:type IV secretion system protein VirB1
MVAPTTMKAIVLEESRGHPYVIHDGRAHRAIFPATREEAIATARQLLAEGVCIDAGLAQINSQNWGRLGLTAETVFDPCTNLRAGERVILDGYTMAPFTVDAAISRYNTGDDTRGIRNGYVGRVKGWMPTQQPNRNYEAIGQSRLEDDEGPAIAGVRLESDREGEGNPGDDQLAQTGARTEDQASEGRKVPAWSFIPALDGFEGGG